MSEQRKPWVGDQVRDEAAERDAIITDVDGGTYLLRALRGRGEWTAESHDHLTVTVPREERTNR